MRAIRVKRSHGIVTVHWLTDDEGTRCGKDVEDLDVIEELEVDRLPTVEACHACQRAVEGGAAVQPDYHRVRAEGGFVAMPATYGRLRKTGPLRKGTGRSGHGHRLR